VNDSSHGNTGDSRLKAALLEYFERVDQGETPDAEVFASQHAEIADELRAVLSANEEIRRLAAEASQDASECSTGSFGKQAQETLVPRPAATPRQQLHDGLSGRFGRYRIEGILGQGAMGTVYLADDTQLHRQVALKTPQFEEDAADEILERFYREARLAATLRHSHICPVYDVGELDGIHYITMAYIEGRPLSDFVKPSVPQTERQILIVVGKIAQALQEAHDHGIVHRDLKPSNIMIDRHGEPVIMDFGLAWQARTGEDTRLTQTGMIVGSPAYMSPEQVEGERAKIGPAADQYGLGVILYELLTGKVPFNGSLATIMGQILTKEPRPPSQVRAGLDPRIDTLCLKMMAKNASDRFRSLSEVALELAKIVREPAAPLSTKGRPSRSKALIAPILVLILAGIFAAAVLYFRVGKAVVEVDISDPDVQVALRGSTLKITGPASQEIQVEPGENELTITYNDLKFKTGEFKLERGDKQVVRVSILGSNIEAKLGEKLLPVVPFAPGGTTTNADLAKKNALPGEPSAAARPMETGNAAAKPASAGLNPAPLSLTFDKKEAEQSKESWARYLGVPVDTTNSVSMKLILVPPGDYFMGPFKGHHVRITRPLYFGVYEVTRGQFARFVDDTNFKTMAETKPGGMRLEDSAKPIKFEPQRRYTWRDPGFSQEDDHPVVQIGWGDATAFCEWLSRKEGKTYRLPTEAEWEYACRAGTFTRLYNSHELEDGTKIGNIADATAKAVFPHWDRGVKSSDGYVYTSPVGRFAPNNFGLYDMIGNAGEWCSDWYDSDYYEHSPENDPTGPDKGTMHVGRGGGFTDVPGTRYRYYGVDVYRRPDGGFRVVCEIKHSTQSSASAKSTNASATKTTEGH